MVVSSYQMNSSCRLNEVADCPLVPAYHCTLSFDDVSQRPPADHWAMPRPGPPPYCTEVGLTPDSLSRLPTMPAAWKLVSPLATKKSKAALSLENSASPVSATSSGAP